MLELAYLLTTTVDLAMVVVVVKEVMVVAKNTGIDIFAHSHCSVFIWFLNYLCADVKVDEVHADDGGGCEKCLYLHICFYKPLHAGHQISIKYTMSLLILLVMVMLRIGDCDDCCCCDGDYVSGDSDDDDGGALSMECGACSA